MSLDDLHGLLSRRLQQREVQWVLPKSDEGIDWGVERVVLVEAGTKQLWWMKSGIAYAGRMLGNAYVEPRLTLVDYDGTRSNWRPRQRELHVGGRLTVTLLCRYAVTIDDWFDFVGLTEQLNPHVTTEIVTA